MIQRCGREAAASCGVQNNYLFHRVRHLFTHGERTLMQRVFFLVSLAFESVRQRFLGSSGAWPLGTVVRNERCPQREIERLRGEALTTDGAILSQLGVDIGRMSLRVWGQEKVYSNVDEFREALTAHNQGNPLSPALFTKIALCSQQGALASVFQMASEHVQKRGLILVSDPDARLTVCVKRDPNDGAWVVCGTKKCMIKKAADSRMVDTGQSCILRTTMRLAANGSALNFTPSYEIV